MPASTQSATATPLRACAVTRLPKPVRLIHHHFQLLAAERRHAAAARGQDRRFAACGDLDEVHAALHLPADLVQHLRAVLGERSHARGHVADPGREIVSQSGVAGQVAPGRRDARARKHAGLDCVAHRDRHLPAAARIADRRDAGAQHLARVPGAADGAVLGRAVEVLLLDVARVAVAQVAMRVHHARHHRHALGVQHDIGVGRQRLRLFGADFFNPAGRHLQPVERRGLAPAAVDQRAVDDVVRHLF